MGYQNTKDCSEVLGPNSTKIWQPLKSPRYDFPGVINVAWHPYENIVSFVTSEGELFIYASFLQPEIAPLLEKTLQPAPFLRDPLAETNGNVQKPIANGVKHTLDPRARRKGTPDSIDDILGSELGGEDDFVEDDDGAGYADEVNGNGKRSNGHLEPQGGFESKRRATNQIWQPRVHRSFQPGSTPWRGNRKYLCKRVLILRSNETHDSQV